MNFQSNCWLQCSFPRNLCFEIFPLEFLYWITQMFKRFVVFFHGNHLIFLILIDKNVSGNMMQICILHMKNYQYCFSVTITWRKLLKWMNSCYPNRNDVHHSFKIFFQKTWYWSINNLLYENNLQVSWDFKKL